jgi:uncharacterized SAM-binding protein YcdF (DUF218 family)
VQLGALLPLGCKRDQNRVVCGLGRSDSCGFLQRLRELTNCGKAYPDALTRRRLFATVEAQSLKGNFRVVHLLMPSNLLALGAVFGLALLFLRPRSGRIVISFSVVAIAIAALSPLGNMMLAPLEQRFPEALYPARDGVEGIIVPGGSYDEIRHPYLSNIVLEEDTEPLALVVDLARRYPEAKIIVTGGSTYEHHTGEASIMKDYFASFGIDPTRIVPEDQSLSTAQHAQFTADLLHPSPSSRWLLLTYGHLMPRAVGAFRKAGFDVFAFPIHLRTGGWNEMWKPDGTASENLRKLDMAAYEWLALVYYKLKGYSDEFFPGPTDSPNNATPNATPNLLSYKPPPRSLPWFSSAGFEDAERKGR